MKKKIFAALLLFISVSFWGCVGRAPADDGAAAFQFSLNDMSGQNVKLADFKDKKEVLLFFWTTTCPFCNIAMKSLMQDYPSLKKDNIEVLAMDIDETKRRVERFFGSDKPAFKVLFDEGGDVARLYGIAGIPTYILVGKDGKIKGRSHRLNDVIETKKAEIIQGSQETTEAGQ